MLTPYTMKVSFVLLLVGFLTLAAFAVIHKPAKPANDILYAERVPAKYRAAFLERVTAIADSMDIEPDWLMVVMCFETGCSFRANITNRHSGATGLIQFIPSTAVGLGITTYQLRRMNPVEQLEYVHKYLARYQHTYKTVYDVYMAIIAPAYAGCRDSTPIYRKYGRTPLDRRRYALNRGLDVDRNGVISVIDIKKSLRRVLPKNY